MGMKIHEWPPKALWEGILRFAILVAVVFTVITIIHAVLPLSECVEMAIGLAVAIPVGVFYRNWLDKRQARKEDAGC